MNTNLCRRFSILYLCALFVLAVGIPVTAAPVYTDRGFIVEPITLDLSSFVLEERSNGPAYLAAVPLDKAFQVVDGVSSVTVWFGDYSFNSRVIYSDTSSRGDDVCYIGNLSLLASNPSDSQLPFGCKLDVLSTSKVIISFAPEFYEVLQTEYSGLVSFAVQPVTKTSMTTSSLMDDTSSVFGSAIGMVGTVVKTVASNPILYLPIVIGLCGIGVGFFRRLKQ